MREKAACIPHTRPDRSSPLLFRGVLIRGFVAGALKRFWHAGVSNVVVVVVQYRLNIFGFLGSHEMQASSSDGSTGNFGLQDQRLSMSWAQQNIRAFGGDPARSVSARSRTPA